MVGVLLSFVRGASISRKILVVGILSLAGVLAWAGVHIWVVSKFRQAEKAFESGMLEEARAHVDMCLKVWPNNPDLRFLAARIERRAGDFAAAEKHLEAYKLQCGVTDKFQTEWILLRAQAGESAQLEPALWACVKKDHPQALEILETLAGCSMRESRFHAARDYLNEWIKREPTNAVALAWRGMVHEYRQEREEAVADYRTALKCDASRWPVRVQLAHLLIDLTRYKEAWRELEVLRATHGRDESVQLALGRCLFSQGETAEARKVFQQMLADGNDAPKQAMVFYFLGKLEAEPARARDWFRKALKIQPASPEARFALCASLRQLGRDKEAAEEWRIYEAMRKQSQQVQKLLDEMERDPNNPDLLTQVGTQLMEKFDNPRGLDLLFRALSFNPNHVGAHESLAKYYEKTKQPVQAAEHREFLPRVKN